MAIVLACIDSRSIPEIVFDQGIGDIFTARVAGNIFNEDILGSMEFACKLGGSKVIMVLGHSACGAVKGACDGAELGNLTTLLSKIKPAIEAEHETTENRNSANAGFVHNVTLQNIKNTVAGIRKSSPTLKALENQASIKIVGAIHDLPSGKVSLVD